MLSAFFKKDLTNIKLCDTIYMLQPEHIYHIGGLTMANENLNEKVSVNINSSTLSEIDLLVDNGFTSLMMIIPILP